MEQEELLIRNDPEAVRLRRMEDTLLVVGSGVILFGVWSIVKALLYLVSDSAGYMEELSVKDLGTPGVVLAFALVGLVLLADLGLRLYVGRSAMAVGRGGKKGVLYLVLAGLIVSGSVITLLMLIVNPASVGEDIVDRIASAAVELTSLVMVSEMIHAGICVRRERERAETARDESRDGDTGAKSPDGRHKAGR